MVSREAFEECRRNASFEFFKRLNLWTSFLDTSASFNK